MEKYLVTIEFRYTDEPTILRSEYKNKYVTIGVYDTFEDACLNGNLLLENLESKFKLHSYPDASKAKRNRFSENDGCFGNKQDLVSNLAYLNTPFNFYAKIETLRYDCIDTSINEILDSVKRYRDYKKDQNND